MQSTSHCSPSDSLTTNLDSSGSPRAAPCEYLDDSMFTGISERIDTSNLNHRLFLTDVVVDSPLRVCRYCNCAILFSVISTHEPLCAMMIEMKKSRQVQANVGIHECSKPSKGPACVEFREARESELQSEDGKRSPSSSSSCGLPPDIDVPTRRPSPEMEITRSFPRSSPTRNCASLPCKRVQSTEKKDGTTSKVSPQGMYIDNERVDGESILKYRISSSPPTTAFAPHSTDFLTGNKKNPIVGGEGVLAARGEGRDGLGAQQKSIEKDSGRSSVVRSLSIGGDKGKGKSAGERRSSYQALVTVRVEESSGERKANDDETVDVVEDEHKGEPSSETESEGYNEQEEEEEVFITALTAGGNSTKYVSRSQICNGEEGKRLRLSARSDRDASQPSYNRALISIEFPDDSGVGDHSASLVRFVSRVIAKELAAHRWDENKADSGVRSVAERQASPRGGTNRTIREDKSADRCGEEKGAFDEVDSDEESVPRLHRSISRGHYEVRPHTEHERKRANSAPARAQTVEQRFHMFTGGNNAVYQVKGKDKSALKRTQAVGIASTVVATPRRNSIENRIRPISPKSAGAVSSQLLSPPPTAFAHKKVFVRAHSSPQCTTLQNQPMRSSAVTITVAAQGRGNPIHQDNISNKNSNGHTFTCNRQAEGSSRRISQLSGSTSTPVAGVEPSLKLVGGYTTGGTPFRVVERSAALAMRSICRASTSTSNPALCRSESQNSTNPSEQQQWGWRSQRASTSPLPSAVSHSRSLGLKQHASTPRSTSVASATGDRSVLSLLEREYQFVGCGKDEEAFNNTCAMGSSVRAGDEEALEELPRLRVVGMVPIERPKSPFSAPNSRLSPKPQITNRRQGRYAAGSARTPLPPSSTRETTASRRGGQASEDQTRKNELTRTPIRTVFVFPISTSNAPRSSSSSRQSQSQPSLNDSSCRATPKRMTSPLPSRTTSERHLSPSTAREQATLSPTNVTIKESRRSVSAGARFGKQPAVTVAFGRTVSARDTRALKIMGVNGL